MRATIRLRCERCGEAPSPMKIRPHDWRATCGCPGVESSGTTIRSALSAWKPSKPAAPAPDVERGPRRGETWTRRDGAEAEIVAVDGGRVVFARNGRRLTLGLEPFKSAYQPGGAS